MKTVFQQSVPCREVAALFPEKLLEALARVHQKIPGEIYLAGGTIRDLLLHRKPADIDLTVACRAIQWAELLAEQIGGTFVLLGREEDAARVVWQGMDVDFSSFREGAASIEQELSKRDITINSMALPVHELLRQTDCERLESFVIIDPVHGLEDLEKQQIRLSSSRCFLADPLRMLRVFRFAARLNFTLDSQVLEQVHLCKDRIKRVSVERISHELDLIMMSPRAAATIQVLQQSGLLWEILPELQAGAGMDQPSSHHLDVFDHCMETLRQMEQVLADPGRYFPENKEEVATYLQAPQRQRLLKWAALFHDVGKPATYAINEDKGGRITFYNHDLQGADIFTSIARRLRWSSDDAHFVARLVAGHMRPFFLANNQRQSKLTTKACLRLIRKIGVHLPGLFLLAMADALAGKGENSPEEIEAEVAGLFARLCTLEESHVAPVRRAPPLITGNDLITELHLSPGPIFRTILEHVEEAQMEQRIATRSEALALAEEFAGRGNAADLQ
jgi:poly(A) polymerase